MASLRVVFSSPSNGWMRITLTAGEQVLTLDVSHVPSDSVSELVSALILLQRGSCREVVRWSLEPDYSEWRFSRSGEAIELVIASRGDSKPVFEHQGESRVVIHSVMKALCDLAADKVWELTKESNHDWSWGFPFEKLSSLKADLKEARKQSEEG